MDENLHWVFICKSYEDAKKMFANYCRDEWLKDLENRPQLVIDCMGLPPDNNDSVIAQWTFVNPYLTWLIHEGAFLTFNDTELMTVAEAEKAWEQHVARFRAESAEREVRIREISAGLSHRVSREDSVA